ncbi:hypothetical protein XELAEV_18012317mg [Xenopus laevis]|uniref:Uncharacterized protein n=1 Tax=Xenopus laevis TaxID=8355 RepID=A0A974DMG4_XENLA|nr:hypothetical protein XELAEV_18012317mg [Xenopus laevis]
MIKQNCASEFFFLLSKTSFQFLICKFQDGVPPPVCNTGLVFGVSPKLPKAQKLYSNKTPMEQLMQLN